jgi:malate dehydrogenase (oxaloacetate-decarboxylating)(NADP+)
VAPAVAKAAIESGVAKHRIEDWDVYKNELDKRLGIDNQVLRVIGSKARRNPKRIVFAEADNLKILKAAQILYDEGVGYPILLGDETKIKLIAAEAGIELDGIPILDPRSEETAEKRTSLWRNIFP